MIDMEEKNLSARALIKTQGKYTRSCQRVTVRLSERQQEMVSDFAVEFGLRPGEVVRACMAACFGTEDFLGPDDKIGVVQAAVYLEGSDS